MNIYIMRHGETSWNNQRKLQGQSDIELNEFGFKIAELTNEGMKNIEFDRIIASPLIRTRQTAAVMAKGRNLEVEIDNRIIEIAFGEGEGVMIDDINASPGTPLYHFLHQPEIYQPMKNGESLADVRKRCVAFVEEVLLPLEGKIDHLLLVSHGAFIRVLISYVQGYTDAQLWERNKHRNCAVTSFSLQDGKLSLIEEGKLYYVDDNHLDW